MRSLLIKSIPSISFWIIAGGLEVSGIEIPWLGYTLIGLGAILLLIPAWPYIRGKKGNVGRDNIQVSSDLILNFYIGAELPKEVSKVSADEKQQPNIHVESHDQQGGITAYQVNIQPGDRQLSDNVTKQLEDYLKSISYKSVEVNAVMGDGEAFRFASQIKNFLTSGGIDVKGVNQVMYAAPVQGQVIEPPNDTGVVKVIIGNR